MNNIEAVPNLTQRLTGILQRKAETTKRRASAEHRLNQERYHLAQAESSRKPYVEMLAKAEDDADRAYTEAEIDKIDAEITSRRRLIEGLDVELTKATAELDSTRAEHRALDQEVEAAERQRAFEDWKKKMEQLYAVAADHLDGARLTLGDLVMTAFHGAETFGPEASRFLSIHSDEFFQKQNGLANRGFSPVHGWNGVMYQFALRPMKKLSR